MYTVRAQRLFSSYSCMQVAERAITADLEFLISKAVDPEKADYAVVAGEA